MSKTVVGIVDSYEKAEHVKRHLENEGFESSDISVIGHDAEGKYSGTGEESQMASGAGTGAAIGGAAGLALGLVALAIPGIGPIVALGPLATALSGAGIGAAAGGLIGGMTHLGVPEEDARAYSDRVKSGGALVMVKAPDNRAQSAAAVLERHGAHGLETRRGDSSPTTSGTTASPQMSDSATIPVVEEELQVGKRQVQHGGIRVYAQVVETPVEEEIHLREERVNVQRRPADRAASEKDFENFREGTIEVNEMVEEPVIAKNQRVVEEVVIGKEVHERTQKVHDTLRKTDVDVEQMGSRDDYETGIYAPGYQYGSQLANDPRYRDRDWNSVESNARGEWENSGHGTWDEFRNAIRHGWDKVRGRA